MTRPAESDILLDMDNILTFTGAKVFVEYRKSEKQIFARDLTDKNNESAAALSETFER